jgi:serine/threonine-protein kinase
MSVQVGALLHKRYRLSERIGEGGSASVFKAVDTRTGRSVAVKLARAVPAVRGSEQPEVVLQRFAREARVLARLDHPNTVQLLDFGTVDDAWFLVMEYLEGETLQGLLRRVGRLSEPTTLAIAIRIARSLHQAHEIGVVHRDVKPANVVLVPRGGREFLVKMLDFGLVKFFSVDEERSLTEQGKWVGSPTYLAPECLGPSRPGAAADLYSLGIMMYEMLAGRPPFREKNPMRQVLAHYHKPPPPLQDDPGASNVTADTAAIVMRCLEKKPDQRWPSAEVLACQIEARLREHTLRPVSCEEVVADDVGVSARDTGALDEAPTVQMGPLPRPTRH